jgi:hypothetical protein
MKDLSDVALEEVSLSAYFQEHKNLPKVGDTLRLRSTAKGSRLAVDQTSAVDVGLLPTEYIAVSFAPCLGGFPMCAGLE